jgi:uncharacterized membrane protein
MSCNTGELTLKNEALMSSWFDLAVLAVVVLLLAIMPWKRPRPNHIFALDMLKLLADEESGVSGATPA